MMWKLIALFIVFCVGLGVLVAYNNPRLMNHQVTCGLLRENVSEIYYVNTMLGKHNRSGSLVGKQPEFDKVINTMRHSDNARYKAMKYVWSKGGRKLDPSEITNVHYLDEPLKRDMPDIFIITNAVLVVSNRLKSLIEEMDSDKHQFLPIKIIRSDKSELQGLYFVLNVLPEKLTLLEEQAAWYSGGIRQITIERPSGDYGDPFLVHASAQGGAHLWRGESQPRVYFISQAFQKRLIAEDIDFFQTYKTACEGEAL